VFGIKVFGQTHTPAFENISIEQGLSQSVVVSLYQDSRGFIWIGTQDGLNRYDGYELIVYKNKPTDTSSISSNYINGITEDKKGNLWIATRVGGVNKLDRSTGKFSKYKIFKDENEKGKYLRSIYADKNGNIWTGGGGTGLIKINPNDNSITAYKKNSSSNSISGDSVITIFEDNAGFLWIGTTSGLNKFDPSKNKWTIFKNDKRNNFSLSDNYVRCIIQDKLGFIWVGTDRGGLNRFDTSTNKFERFIHSTSNTNSISGNSVNSLWEGIDNSVWAGVWGGGVNKFNYDTHTFEIYKSDPLSSPTIFSNDINSVYLDKTGVLWIGSYGGGLYKFNTNISPFKHFKRNPLEKNHLSNDLIISILKDKEGVLWIGTWGGGLNRMDPVTKSFSSFRYNRENSKSISNNRITSLVEDSNQNLWIGTLDGGLNKFNKKTNTFTRFLKQANNPNSLCSDRITSLLFDSRGNLWIGTLDKGVCVLDMKNEIFKNIFNEQIYDKTMSGMRINSIFEDREGNIWLSTITGLNKYNPNDKSFQHFTQNNNNPNSLSSNWINTVFQSKDGSIWIGTMEGGLNKVIVRNGKTEFEHFTEEEGLPNNNVYRILEDDNSNLWISTNKGISKFNPAKNIFRNYDMSDGLQSDEFKDGAFYDAQTKTMYFGGINGFNSFIPAEVKNEGVPPKVVLTKFRIFNKEILPGENSVLIKPIEETNEITLSYNDYLFSIEFAALKTASPGKIKYAYKLEGLDKNWNYTNSKMRFASYTNLDGGKYIFRVKASNNYGSWHDDGIALTIIINPPFWLTWWFRFLVLLFAAIFIFVLFNMRTRKIRESNRLLEEKVKQRTRELSEANLAKDKIFSIIAHDLKNPFTVFYGYTELLDKNIDKMTKEETKEIASSIRVSASKIFSLLENLLEWAQLQLGGLKTTPEVLNLKSLFDSVLFTLSDTAAQKNITLINNINAEIKIFADDHMIKTVARNIVSNSIKFTRPGGFIEIGASANVTCEIYIKDNGVGIPKEKIARMFEAGSKISETGTANERGTGLGLILCKEFVVKNNGSIWIESEEGVGTTVKISLPLPPAGF
jgi:ligand-binding sensor domain-containing protein/signal transduction histidine kinase